MASDQRWKWAGIVSVVSVGGVLITDIVANLVGGYISDQIKASWEMPDEATAAIKASDTEDEVVSSIPTRPAPQPQMAAIAPEPLPVERPEQVATREPEEGSEPELEPEGVVAPEPMPLPPSQSTAVSGTVDKVIDTGTIKIEGETVLLAGIKGLGSPYADQLAKFIEEQGSQIQCSPRGERHTCFVGSIDLALAALTNGAARLAPDATPQYRQAEDEARRNRRGVFQ